MDKNKIVYWSPRIISIIFILFISIFAFDVFGEGYGFPEVLVALFMHLIPSFILIGLTILAWKKPKIGGWFFISLGIGFTIFFNTYREIISFLIISGPVFLIGALYLIESYNKKKK